MASVIENYQSTSEKTPHQVAWWLNIESVQPGNNSTTNEFKSQKKLRETAPPVQQQQQQSDCCCCCCVTSKKWHHTHEANDRKINPLGWFSTRKEKRGADLPCKRRTPPPSSRLRLASGVGRTIRTSSLDGKIKGPFGKPWTWQLPHWFGIWCSVQNSCRWRFSW
jgi:hypothetical protein